MEETNKSKTNMSLIIRFIIRHPYLLIPIGLFIFFFILILILLATIASNKNNGLFEEAYDECAAIGIEINGTIENDVVNLTLFGESDFKIKDIKGKKNGNSFTAEKKLSAEEKAKLLSGNAAKLWNYFITHGYSEAATAGILGNLTVESGLDPSKHQYNGGPGRGLAQWTVGGGRWKGLLNLADKRGTKWDDLLTQAEWITKEIDGGSWINDVESFKKSNNIEEATKIFCYEYERPGVPHINNRISHAKENYNKFNGKLYGDVKLTGEIEGDKVLIEGTVGSEDITTSGNYKSGEISTSGYLGDTTNCFMNASICGFSWPLKKQPHNYSKPACVFRGSMGSYHCGDDYSHYVTVGTPIYAVMDGKVTIASYYNGYGNTVEILHGDIYGNGKNVYSLYGHMSSLSVKKGQSVEAGQQIGKAGSTGNSTGPHLHFELNYSSGGGSKGSACSNSVCYKQNLKEGNYTLLEQLEKQAKSNCSNGNISPQSFLNSLEKMSNQVEKDKKNNKRWTYSNSNTKNTFDKANSSTKSTNCALYVSWALIDVGVMSSGDRFYKKSSQKIQYSKNAENKMKKYLDYISGGNKKASTLIKNGTLKAGDIVLWYNEQHTNVYAGNGKWYDAGRWPGNNGSKSAGNHKFSTLGPVKISGLNNWKVWKILRLK